MKIDKEELQWWIEDNKSKFYGICTVGVIVLCGILFGIYSLVKPEPEVIVEEPDTYEEIVIGRFDTEGAIQEQKETEEERRNREYGLMYTLLPNSYYYLDKPNYGYGFVTMVSKSDGSTFRLLVNNDMYSESEDTPVSASNWNFLMQDANTYSCRGNFENLDSKTIALWADRDYKEVLDLFRNKDVNAAASKKWDVLFTEEKVAKGYKKQAKNDTITPEDMQDIMDSTYIAFEKYLLSLDTDEDGQMGPLTSYLTENPLPNYSDVKVVSTPLYICEMDGKMWSKFGERGVNTYFDTYWSTYFYTVQELFINEGDTVSISEKGMEPAVPYKMTKKVNFSLFSGDLADKEYILWYKTDDRINHYKYFPAVEWKIIPRDDSQSTIEIPNNTEYFGYYIIGENYRVDNTGTFMIEVKGTNDGEIVSESRTFTIEDNICYTREDFCGNENYVNVSEFIMLDGIYDIPTGKVYIKNDTEYFLDFSTPDQAYHYDGFGPGQEIFFNPPESRTITWKVVE